MALNITSENGRLCDFSEVVEVYYFGDTNVLMMSFKTVSNKYRYFLFYLEDMPEEDSSSNIRGLITNLMSQHEDPEQLIGSEFFNQLLELNNDQYFNDYTMVAINETVSNLTFIFKGQNPDEPWFTFDISFGRNLSISRQFFQM